MYIADRSAFRSDIADTAAALPTDIADSPVRGRTDRGGMPWKATDAMKERTKFVLEWERRREEAEGGAVNMAELCLMFGVSRQTAYKRSPRRGAPGTCAARMGAACIETRHGPSRVAHLPFCGPRLMPG